MSDNDPAQCLQTLRDFIRWGASRMNEAGVSFGHGTGDALDEAAFLVLHALHLPPDLHGDYFAAVLTPAERHTVLALLEQRVRERKPAAYLTRRTWFMGLPFYVDERVIIPRSPMAELIERHFAPWLPNVNIDAVERILDLCTGSGCLGIACAHVFPQSRVDLADISADALEVARRNTREHDLDNRVQLIQSDLFSALGGRRYDLIVSNPPYVSLNELSRLPPEYRHEPTLGLVAGEQGLDVVVEILRQAARYLKPEGILVVEVGHTHHALSETFPEVPFVWLELERGGEGVFLLTAEQLREYGALFTRGG
jgi:ribosomal protein L3 glutamine methyltransferase